jgi:hypothetical protein
VAGAVVEFSSVDKDKGYRASPVLDLVPASSILLSTSTSALSCLIRCSQCSCKGEVEFTWIMPLSAAIKLVECQAGHSPSSRSVPSPSPLRRYRCSFHRDHEAGRTSSKTLIWSVRVSPEPTLLSDEEVLSLSP